MRSPNTEPIRTVGEAPLPTHVEELEGASHARPIRTVDAHECVRRHRPGRRNRDGTRVLDPDGEVLQVSARHAVWALADGALMVDEHVGAVEALRIVGTNRLANPVLHVPRTQDRKSVV